MKTGKKLKLIFYVYKRVEKSGKTKLDREISGQNQYFCGGFLLGNNDKPKVPCKRFLVRLFKKKKK